MTAVAAGGGVGAAAADDGGAGAGAAAGGAAAGERAPMAGGRGNRSWPGFQQNASFGRDGSVGLCVDSSEPVTTGATYPRTHEPPSDLPLAASHLLPLCGTARAFEIDQILSMLARDTCTRY